MSLYARRIRVHAMRLSLAANPSGRANKVAAKEEHSREEAEQRLCANCAACNRTAGATREGKGSPTARARRRGSTCVARSAGHAAGARADGVHQIHGGGVAQQGALARIELVCSSSGTACRGIARGGSRQFALRRHRAAAECVSASSGIARVGWGANVTTCARHRALSRVLRTLTVCDIIARGGRWQGARSRASAKGESAGVHDAAVGCRARITGSASHGALVLPQSGRCSRCTIGGDIAGGGGEQMAHLLGSATAEREGAPVCAAGRGCSALVMV